MRIKQYLSKTILGGLAALTLGSSGCTSTESGEIAVAYCKWWCGDNPIHVIEPGHTEFLFPGRYNVEKVNIEMQSFLMTKDPSTGARSSEDDLVFKTNEGNNIGQDVVVTWRMDRQKVDDIIRNTGNDLEAIAEKYVRPLARTIVRNEFNLLDSREFYESQKRFEAAAKATTKLQQALAPYGIIVDQVSPRDYRFEDDTYQKTINAAKNAGQDRERFLQEKSSKEELWKRNLNERIGTSKEMIATEEGAKASAIHTADAEYIKAQNKATGITAEMKAKATSITILRDAMASQGGDVAVKMRYAEYFKPQEIIVVPCGQGGVSLDYIDLNKILQGEVKK